MNFVLLRPWVAVCFASTWMACQPLRDLDATSAGNPTTEPSGSFTGDAPGPPFPVASTSSTSVSSAGTQPVMQASPPDSATALELEGSTSASDETSAATETAASTHDESSTLTSPTSEPSSSETTFSEGPRDDTTTPDTTTSDTSSMASSETSEPSDCQSQCALGEACTSAAQCLSFRCDDYCSPTELIVESDGLDAISTSIKVHVELYADPAISIAWKDLAVLYFFTVERRDDFVMHFQQGGGSALPVQVGLTDWILVWQSDQAGNVPSTVTPFDVQFRSDPWLPDTPESNDNSNDHSYREGLGPNENIVLCRQVAGRWEHIQGTPPATIPDPCRYVDNCDAALSCDPLQLVD